MHWSKKYWSITIACILTGFLLAFALKTQTVIQGGQKLNKNKGLIDIITNLEQETDLLEEAIVTIRNQIDQFQQEQTAGQGLSAELQNQIQRLKLRAGLIEVTGPGIIIVLDDNITGAEAAKTNQPALYDPEDYIVHDKNLLYLVSSLKGQAEALAINNQRILPNSDIRCVGTVIMVNSTRLAPPYEIKAIGNPDLLEAAVMNSDEYIYLKSKEMPVKLTKADIINIPAYKGSHSLNYAQAIKEGDK